MRDLTAPGGIVVRDEVVRPSTAGWRTNGKPVVDLARCIDCLLCWVYCPDSAIALDGTARALPKRGYLLQGKHPISVRVLAPLEPASFAELSLEELTARVQAIIAAELPGEARPLAQSA